MRSLPTQGIVREELFQILTARKNQDINWRKGRSWSLVYYAGDEHTDFLTEVFRLFFSENGLSPRAFPSLHLLETEVIAMLINLLGGDERAVGTMTSGGTESILMAVKAYRDKARANPSVLGCPEMVVPSTAHPAFFKAASYFDVKAVIVPVGADFRANPVAMAQACNERTILIVASAPSFPQGVIDPIEELAELALQGGAGLHIDACLGGFILPFLSKLGYDVPAFDFGVPGVSSISADLHKYGYAAKGASAVLYRDRELLQHQFFVYADWPGGLYASPSMTGTRPGGAIAAAWAAMMSLGEHGYLELARETMVLTDFLKSGIVAIPGMYIVGEPAMGVMAFSSKNVDIFTIGDLMEEKGWTLDRQNDPDSLHIIVTPNHRQSAQAFLEDLNEAAARAVCLDAQPSNQRAMLYGVTTQIERTDDAAGYALRIIDEMYTQKDWTCPGVLNAMPSALGQDEEK